jgi:hypothetical protein
MRIAAVIVALCATSISLAKKPPLSVNAPEVVRRYWEVDLRVERGRLRFVRVRPRLAPRGQRILRMAGPFRLILVGKTGEIDRYEFGFPLLGPGEVDKALAAGLTAETRVHIPHRPALRRLVAQGPEGFRSAEHRLRWRRR